MFGRFTDRSRRVVVLAQEAARELQHHQLGTEHILLGLLQEDEGIAAQMLQAQGLTARGVRGRIMDVVGVGSQAPAGHIPFTVHAKMALEHSSREALLLGHNYIGTEHLLLGLLRAGDGRDGRGGATRILSDLLVDRDDLRQSVIDTVIYLSPAQPPPDPDSVAAAARRRAEAWRQFMLDNDPPVVP